MSRPTPPMPPASAGSSSAAFFVALRPSGLQPRPGLEGPRSSDIRLRHLRRGSLHPALDDAMDDPRRIRRGAQAPVLLPGCRDRGRPVTRRPPWPTRSSSSPARSGGCSRFRRLLAPSPRCARRDPSSRFPYRLSPGPLFWSEHNNAMKADAILLAWHGSRPEALDWIRHEVSRRLLAAGSVLGKGCANVSGRLQRWPERFGSPGPSRPRPRRYPASLHNGCEVVHGRTIRPRPPEQAAEVRIREGISMPVERVEGNFWRLIHPLDTRSLNARARSPTSWPRRPRSRSLTTCATGAAQAPRRPGSRLPASTTPSSTATPGFVKGLCWRSAPARPAADRARGSPPPVHRLQRPQGDREAALPGRRPGERVHPAPPRPPRVCCAAPGAPGGRRNRVYEEPGEGF